MNISQKTYDALDDQLYSFDARRLSRIQVRELFEAYEHAVKLLDRAMLECDLSEDLEDKVGEFLYLDNGDPRVVLSNESQDL